MREGIDTNLVHANEYSVAFMMDGVQREKLVRTTQNWQEFIAGIAKTGLPYEDYVVMPGAVLYFKNLSPEGFGQANGNNYCNCKLCRT